MKTTDIVTLIFLALFIGALILSRWLPARSRAELEREQARRRAFNAWRSDPPAFINAMRDAREVVRWLGEQMDEAMSEWPRVFGFEDLMSAVAASRFREELAPLIRQLTLYREDPIHRPDPIPRWLAMLDPDKEE